MNYLLSWHHNNNNYKNKGIEKFCLNHKLLLPVSPLPSPALPSLYPRSPPSLPLTPSSCHHRFQNCRNQLSFSILLYFHYSVHFLQRILLDFPSVTSLAYMPFLSCHRTTPTLSPPLDEILVRRNFRLTFGWRSTHCTSKDIIIIISRSWYRHCQISCWGASNLCCNYALHEIDLAPNGILSDYANWSIIIKLDSVWIRKFQQIYLWVRLPQ